eukprot:COSAG04_NODE_2955_length_3350_cov_2.909566_3_plen_137_part_01
MAMRMVRVRAQLVKGARVSDGANGRSRTDGVEQQALEPRGERDRLAAGLVHHPVLRRCELARDGLDVARLEAKTVQPQQLRRTKPYFKQPPRRGWCGWEKKGGGGGGGARVVGHAAPRGRRPAERVPRGGWPPPPPR